MMEMVQTLQYVGRGNIWQVLPVQNSNQWVVEERLPDGKVQYSLLDKTGDPEWTQVPWPEKWWTYLADVAEGKVLIREYSDEQTPERQHLHALNLANGNHEWGVDNFSFFTAPSTVAYGYLSSEKEPIWGEVSLDSGTWTPTNREPLSPVENNDILRPFLYQAEEEGFATVKAFVFHISQRKAVVGAEYLETPLGVGVSWHEDEGNGKVTNWLWWLSPEGEPKLQLALGKGLSGMGQDTFWVYRGQLFFIKDKKEFVGYAL